MDATRLFRPGHPGAKQTGVEYYVQYDKILLCEFAFPLPFPD